MLSWLRDYFNGLKRNRGTRAVPPGCGAPILGNFIKVPGFTRLPPWIESTNFEIVKEIAGGELGILYLARTERPNLPPNVILKVLERHGDDMADLINEFRMHVKIKEGYVPRCYGYSEHPTTQMAALVLEYYPDGDLRTCIAQLGMKPWRYRLGILKDILSSLTRIHHKNVVHRDLHSGNILLKNSNSCGDREAWISDLGLARLADQITVSEDGTYGIMPYMAPELFQRRPHSKATDIYAVGIIMWELATGKLAFSDRSHNDTLIHSIIGGERPTSLEEMPECWRQLMKQCWDVNASNRPTARDAMTTVERWYKLARSPDNDTYREFVSRHCAIQADPVQIPHHHGAIYSGRIISHVPISTGERYVV